MSYLLHSYSTNEKIMLRENECGRSHLPGDESVSGEGEGRGERSRNVLPSQVLWHVSEGRRQDHDIEASLSHTKSSCLKH